MLVVAWGVGLRWSVGWRVYRSTGCMDVGLAEGGLSYESTPWKANLTLGPRFEFYKRTTFAVGNVWLPKHLKASGGSFLFCPIWMLLLPVALPAAYLFYRDRRHPPGHCPRCGYDLTGNESGVCPECGT